MVSYRCTSTPRGTFGCFVRLEHGNTSPKLSVLAQQYLFGALFRRFIICAVKVYSAEQVAELIQDVKAIVWHGHHSLNWLPRQTSTVLSDWDQDLIPFRRLAEKRGLKTTCSS